MDLEAQSDFPLLEQALPNRRLETEALSGSQGLDPGDSAFRKKGSLRKISPAF